MDFITLMNHLMDFQEKTDARFFVQDGRIQCVIPTSFENVQLFEAGQRMFEPAE